MFETAASMSRRSSGVSSTVGRAEIFLEAMQLCGSGDRHDPGLLCQQPGQGDLCRRRLFPGRDLPKQLDAGLIGLPHLGREAGAMLRISVLSNCVSALMAPVRKPFPNGRTEQSRCQVPRVSAGFRAPAPATKANTRSAARSPAAQRVRGGSFERPLRTGRNA